MCKQSTLLAYGLIVSDRRLNVGSLYNPYYGITSVRLQPVGPSITGHSLHNRQRWCTTQHYIPRYFFFPVILNPRTTTNTLGPPNKWFSTFVYLCSFYTIWKCLRTNSQNNRCSIFLYIKNETIIQFIIFHVWNFILLENDYNNTRKRLICTKRKLNM